MLVWVGKVFHKMLNPHCPHCVLERECPNCDLLRQMLETEKFEKTQLLNRILGPTAQQEQKQQIFIPNEKQYPPFRIRKAQLEAKDRELFEKIMAERNAPKTTEELEKELGVTNASE
jgi:hypothetical protein